MPSTMTVSEWTSMRRAARIGTGFGSIVPAAGANASVAAAGSGKHRRVNGRAISHNRNSARSSGPGAASGRRHVRRRRGGGPSVHRGVGAGGVHSGSPLGRSCAGAVAARLPRRTTAARLPRRIRAARSPQRRMTAARFSLPASRACRRRSARLRQASGSGSFPARAAHGPTIAR